MRTRFLLVGFAAIAWSTFAGVLSGSERQANPSDKSAAANRAGSRLKPFAPEKLVRAFRGNREDVRQKALDDAERSHMADPQLPGALWQVIEPALKIIRVPESVLRAIQLYARLNDEDEPARLVVLLSAQDPRVMLAAIDLLAERRPAGSLERLTGLVEHPAFKSSYGFRQALVSAVARFEEPASVDFLIAAIGRADGQLKYEAAKHLARLTGENFGGKSDEWRQWWDKNRSGFRVAHPVAVGAAAGVKPPATPVPWDYDPPQFFGTPIFAKRVVFVIDKSKSMLSSVDGITRLDNAEKELEAAIRKLPDDAWFEIVAYNDSEQVFRGKLAQATPLEKSGAVQFIYSLVAEGRTDIYDTLADALGVDPNLEALLFLSDGDPNVGSIIDRTKIIQNITRQNAARRTSIYTIGIDARGAAEDFLKQLAADNFGDFRSSR